MKIKALLNFFVPGLPGFVEGETYDVTEAVGLALVERQQAEQVAVAAQTAKKTKSEGKAQ